MRVLLSIAAALMIFPMHAADPLADHQWKNRVVLVFGTMEDVGKQVAEWSSDRAGFLERDTLISKISDGSADATKLREQFKAAGFTVILIGKDGGEKFRSKVPVRASELFAQIDAMPMRQREMRER